jgi:hypothetical protein
MIRLGSSCTTVTPMVFWLMTQRKPITELRMTQGAPASKTNATRNLTPLEITSVGPAAALPDRQRLPAKNIPKLIYP